MAKEKEETIFTAVPPNVPKPEGNPPVDDGLPEELKGKTPAEVFQIAQQEHNKVMAETVEALKPKVVNTPPAAPVPPRRTYTPPPVTQQQEEVPDQNLEPDKFMDYQFNKRLGPLVQQQTAALRGTNKAVFQGKIGEEEWGKYGEEIERFVDGMHPQLQAHPEVYRNAYNLVVASHKDEIIEEESNKKAMLAVTRVLAKAGMTPEAITDTLRATAEGSPIKLPEMPTQPKQSLFQPHTGVRSQQQIVDPLKSAIRSQYPQDHKPKKAYHDDAKAVMQEFDMTPEEYDEFAAENTDLVSQINRGEFAQ